MLVGDVLDVSQIPGGLRSSCLAHGPEAFVPGGGGEPARKRGRFADLVKPFHQVQPDVLANVVGVGAAQPVLAADRPDERGVPLDECVPRLLFAVSGARHQVSDRWVTSDRAYFSGHDLVLLPRTGILIGPRHSGHGSGTGASPGAVAVDASLRVKRPAAHQ